MKRSPCKINLCLLNQLLRILKYRHQYLSKFSRVDQVLQVVLFGSEETGSKYNCQIVCIHLIEIFLSNYVVVEKDYQKYKHLVVDVLHPLQHLFDEGHLVLGLVIDHLRIQFVVEDGVA